MSDMNDARRQLHAELYPDGCGGSWEKMCDDCCERLDAYPHEAVCNCDKCADDAAGLTWEVDT